MNNHGRTCRRDGLAVGYIFMYRIEGSWAEPLFGRPTWPLILTIGVALVLLLLWLQRRQRWQVMIGLIAVNCCAITIAADMLFVTDKELLSETVIRMKDAVLASDMIRLSSWIDHGFKHAGFSKETILAAIERGRATVRLDRVRIDSVTIQTRDMGNRREADVDLMTTGYLKPEELNLRMVWSQWALGFQVDGWDCKLVRLDPVAVNGQRIGDLNDLLRLAR